MAPTVHQAHAKDQNRQVRITEEDASESHYDEDERVDFALSAQSPYMVQAGRRQTMQTITQS